MMKKVVVRSHSSLPSVDGKAQIGTCEDSYFEAPEGCLIRVINTNEGLLLIEVAESEKCITIAVFNKGEWIYWKQLPNDLPIPKELSPTVEP